MSEKRMNTAFLRIRLTIPIMALLVAALPISGQTPGTGAISGIVYDPGNRVVANAQVLAVNEATLGSRLVTATSEGVFRLPLWSRGDTQ